MEHIQPINKIAFVYNFNGVFFLLILKIDEDTREMILESLFI